MHPIADLVICTPITIQDAAAVDELATIFVERLNDAVPAVDPARGPTGLIDMQDLLALDAPTDTGDATS